MISVVVPMAGSGERFKVANFDRPKPFIEFKGKPLIYWALLPYLNSHLIRDIIIVSKKSIYNRENRKILRNISEKIQVTCIDYDTEGQADTARIGCELVDKNFPLIITNCDQYIKLKNEHEAFCEWVCSGADGYIVTFRGDEDRWSFAKTDNSGNVIETAEKKVISNNATAGMYYWRKSSDFTKYYNEMKEENDRVNNEFYVCPVYNYAIKDGKKIRVEECQKHLDLGTPSALQMSKENFQV